MDESILIERIEDMPSFAVPKAFNTIVYGGLTVGTLDAIAACTNAWFRSGVTPDRVFKYIASALLGRDVAYESGFAPVLLGVLMHYSIAFGVATTFYLISSRLPVLLRYAVIVGMAYGIAVYFVMGYLIVPLTRVQQGQSTWTRMITGIFIHMFCVGLPPALIARYSTKYAEKSE
jgi:hypothetical protein